MTRDDPEIENLLDPAAAGDEVALRRLLDRHRERLRRMIAARLDPRLSARLDPSDVLQEALADAGRKLHQYARERPLPRPTTFVVTLGPLDDAPRLTPGAVAGSP